MTTTASTSVEQAIESLVYRSPVPMERVKQGLRIDHALIDIIDERRRQEEIGDRKRAQGIEWRSCADPRMDGGDFARNTVLGEEVGEVARAVLETSYGVDTDEHLRRELVEVAAVSLAWIEAIDARNNS